MSMKNILIVITIIICAIYNNNANAQDAFIEYTINGMPYKATADQFLAYQSFNQDYNVEGKRACRSVTASVSGTHGLLYTLQLDINIDTLKLFAPETFALDASTTFLKKVPCAFIKITKNIGGKEKYEFYETEKKAKGTVTITKVDGNWIEGIFEAEVTAQYPFRAKAPLKLTKGKFRFEANMQE
jgi:hypothetical protein